MQFVRRMVVGFGTSLFVLLMTVAVILFCLNQVFGSPKQIKLWLRQSGIYTTAVDSIISQNTIDQQNQPDNSDLTIKRPEVQVALKQAFTPTWLEQSASAILDGTYDWLQGKTPKPNYIVDLVGPKQAFATALGESAKSRLATLPACSLRNLPNSTDPFTVNCQPPIDVQNADVQKFVQDTLNNKDFLPQNQITADTTNLGGEDTQTPQSDQTQPTQPQKPALPWYQNASKLPTLYAWAQRGPWLLSLVALLVGAAVVFAASSKRKGAQHLAISLLTSSLLLAVGVGLLWYISSRISTTSLFKPAEITPATTSLQNSFVYIIKHATIALARLQTISALGLATVSTAALVALRLTRPPKTPDKIGTPHSPLA